VRYRFIAETDDEDEDEDEDETVRVADRVWHQCRAAEPPRP
jgi:hypothetical protein